MAATNDELQLAARCQLSAISGHLLNLYRQHSRDLGDFL
jgi:hypothetical protein